MTEDYFTKGSNGLYSKEWFSSREIIGGPSTRALFAKLLGVDLTGGFLRKAAWKKRYFLIVLKNGNRVAVKEYNESESESYAKFDAAERAGDSVILLKGEPDKKTMDVLASLRESLLRIRPSLMFRTIFLDEGSIARRNGKIEKNYLEFSQGGNYFFKWGGEETKLLFMAHELYRTRTGGELSIKPCGKISYITHADYECIKMAEHTEETPYYNSFLDLPKETLTADRHSGKMPDDDEAQSVLYEFETINGGAENLKKVISHELEKNPERDMIVHCCCTPLLIGDDASSISKSMSKNKGCSIIYSDISHGESQDKFIGVYESRIGLIKEEVKEKSSINLVGFPKDSSYSEIESNLEVLGIKINSRILPAIDENDFARMKKAELQVLFPNSIYEGIYSRVFKRIGMPSISPAAPYGFNMTERWFKSVAGALGIDCKTNSEWQNKFKQLEEEYCALRKKAEKFTLGLVVSKRDIEMLAEPSRFFNSIPLIEMLEDMGFRLSIMVCSGKNECLALMGQLKKMIGCIEKHELVFCSSNDELDLWLKRQDIQCIFSDYKFDKRITRNGKNRFSLALNFERGFNGAINSLEKMLGICGRGFNKKYAYAFGGPVQTLNKEGDEICLVKQNALT